MSDKHEWRKQEKALYLPKAKPELVEVPAFNFITLRGEGSPAEQRFSDIVGTLYSVAYGIKMLPKKMAVKPKGYYDYTVYPLEGVWDINDEAKKTFDGTVKQEDFVYEVMIRQPDFVDEVLFGDILETVKQKKPNPLLDEVEFKSFEEGKCIQMLHVGKFEDEPATFEIMEAFAEAEGYSRLSKVHREVYLSDARKVAPEKLKTVLRFNV
ncbi:GyrI-like domain-containing protein [Maricurvus nonylphenolicus]|uniref:GyrI-like domain-containing protein n=1 Tax=Maricurvus nonylphenolicus TaxID=1008307 RepID=UPI0036F3327E